MVNGEESLYLLSQGQPSETKPTFGAAGIGAALGAIGGVADMGNRLKTLNPEL